VQRAALIVWRTATAVEREGRLFAEFKMLTIAKLTLASVLVLLIGASAQAQAPRQGDYYSPTQTPAPQASPGQEQQIKQGDFYRPGTTVPQAASPAEQQQNQQGDFYKPSK
jgi:hypothetical protein